MDYTRYGSDADRASQTNALQSTATVTLNSLYTTTNDFKYITHGYDGSSGTNTLHNVELWIGTDSLTPVQQAPTSTTGSIGTALQDPNLIYTDADLPDNTDTLSVGGFVKLDTTSTTATFSSPQVTNTYVISTSGGSSTSCGTEYDKSLSTWRWSMQRPSGDTTTDSCVITGFQVDTSSIPDNSIITDVSLTFDTQTIPGWGNLSGKECAVYDVTTDLSGTVSSAMLTDITTGTNYIGSGDTACHSGVNTYDLGSQADTDLQNNLSNDFFAMGLGWTDFTRNNNEIGTGDLRNLSLTVSYDEINVANTKLLNLNDVTFSVGTTTASVDGFVTGNAWSFDGNDIVDLGTSMLDRKSVV